MCWCVFLCGGVCNFSQLLKVVPPCPGLFHSLLKPHPCWQIPWSLTARPQHVFFPPFKNAFVDPTAFQIKGRLFWLADRICFHHFQITPYVPSDVTLQSWFSSCFHVWAHVTNTSPHLSPMCTWTAHVHPGVGFSQKLTLRQGLECVFWGVDTRNQQ